MQCTAGVIIPSVFILKVAVEDLSKIWDYAFEPWSETQADNYYEFLILNSQEIAGNPSLDKNHDGIIQKLFGMKVGEEQQRES